MSAKSDAKFASRDVLARDFLKPNDHLAADVVTLGAYSETFYNRFGIRPGIVWKKFEDVINEIPSILTRNTDASTPSVFKRSSAFTIAFIKISPLEQPFHTKHFQSPLTGITNHQNAIVAFEYCRQILHGSSYVMKSDDKNHERTVILNKRIKVSAHFYYDTIHAVSNIKDDTSFHFISLLYESLAYKSNRLACYPEVI